MNAGASEQANRKLGQARVREATLLVVDDPVFDEHAPRGYHPERPERLAAARQAVADAVARGAKVEAVVARAATDAEVLRVHDAAYLEELGKLAGQFAAIDADTYVAPGSVNAARRGAGGSIALIDALLDRPAGTARGVALLRPPGHHATRAQGMGFCLINNAAVAAAHAVEARGLSRVAVIDWDVHHGNGTQDIFWKDPRVLYLSLHQFPLYPGTGHVEEAGMGDGKGFTVNVPLSPSAGPEVYARAFEAVVEPVLGEFAPELVIVSAGFDAHERDPLASMRLDDAAYGKMAAALAKIADRSASGRLAMLLEGGYDLTAIQGALGASIDAVLGASPSDEKASTADSARAPVGSRHADEVAEAHRIAKARWAI